MKETERILDKLIGGVFTSFSSREKFFQRMGRAGVPPLKMDITRSKIIKTIKTEVKNNQLEPTEENIDKRIGELLNKYKDPTKAQQAIEISNNKEIALENKFGVRFKGKIITKKP